MSSAASLACSLRGRAITRNGRRRGLARSGSVGYRHCPSRRGGLLSRTLFFSLTAALNPTLLAATTVMLVLPSPKRLLLGYLLGAMLTSISLGLVIVFTLSGSSTATSTAQHTVNPASTSRWAC